MPMVSDMEPDVIARPRLLETAGKTWVGRPPLIVFGLLTRHTRTDDRDRESVVPLPAHRLECCRAETRRVVDQLEHAARALDTGERVGGICDSASPHDIIDDNHAAGARKLERPREIRRIVHLVRV